MNGAGEQREQHRRFRSTVHRAEAPLTLTDSGTGESALQISHHYQEAIIVQVLLKYGANYICNSAPCFFLLLLSFGIIKNKPLGF